MNATINFDDLPDGTPLPGGAYVSTEWLSAYGVKLSASGGFSDLPRLFNTSDVGDQELGDPDLGSPNEKCSPPGPGVGVGGEPGMPGENCVPQGNVLIIQEADTEQPDDNVDGGTITFEFVSTADTVYEIGLMDIDYRSNIEVVYEDENGDEVTATIKIPLTGDNGVTAIAINYDNVSELRLNLSRSGAVTFISFCYKPDTPAPAPTPSRTPTISAPTKFVTQVPTELPSRSPVISSPTKATAPSSVPTRAPVADPTLVPTMIPSRPPVTGKPTKVTQPTAVPTRGSDSSSDSPSASPSESPSEAPTVVTGTPSPTRSSPTVSSSCTETILDFEELPDGTPLIGGTYLDSQWLEEYGLTLSASGGFSDLPRLFNTSSVGDEEVGDADLGSPNAKCANPGPGEGVGGEPGMPGENCVPLGNVLIIQEADTDQPDDAGDGGTITFSFDFEVDFVNEIGMLDIDYEGTIEVTYLNSKDSIKTKTFDLALLGDNAVQVIKIEVARVTQIKVTLSRSGAVSYLSFCYKSPAPGNTAPPAPEGLTQMPSVAPVEAPYKRLLAEEEEHDIIQVAADKCKTTGFENPVEILSQDDETVTFSISQVWKCGENAKLGWIATDYFATNGELTCSKTDSVECKSVTTYTAQCIDESTVVDIFVYDDDDLSLFGQLDESEVELPTACNTSGNGSNVCHFRYLLNCKARKEEETMLRAYQKKEKRFWLL